MSNQCVKTGARVLVVEYGGVAPADLFLVGNAIVARFGCGNKIELNYEPEAVANATHRLRLGQRGWYRDDLGVAVAPIDQLEGDLVGPMGVPLKPADVAALFRPLEATCPSCGGAGALTIHHPSQDPQLERDATCPRCYGQGAVALDQGMLEDLERDRAKLAKLQERQGDAGAVLQQIARELRERRVNNGRSESATLVAWADRIEAALAQVGAA